MLSRCRNLRKALAVTLSFMMVMTMCTFNIPPSYADTGTIELMDPSGSPTGVYYSISDTGVLSFTGSGAIPSYSVTDTDPNYYKSAPWQSSYVVDSITRIEINEGITAVGSYAFYKMTSVSSVSFPESSLRSILTCSFSEMTGLTSVIMPASVEAIGQKAFFGDKNLEAINLPSKLTGIGVYAMGNCSTASSPLTVYVDYYVNTDTMASFRSLFPASWSGVIIPYKYEADGVTVKTDADGNPVYDYSDGFNTPTVKYEVRTVVDPNCGTVVSVSDYNATYTTYVKPGASVTCKAQPATGYTFQTWNTYRASANEEISEEVSYAQRVANQSFDLSTHPVTYCYTATIDAANPVPQKYSPVFSKIVYNVTFNTNMGSFDTTSPQNVQSAANGVTFSPANSEVATSASANVIYGQTFAEALGGENLPVPQREGYQFKGWFTATVVGTEITSSSTVPADSDTNLILYAQWTSNDYKVIFNKGLLEHPDGQPDGTPAGRVTGEMTDQDMKYGVATALKNCSYNAQGYKFLGWYPEIYPPADPGELIQDGAEVSNLTTANNGTVTLYAVWGFDLKYNYGVNSSGAGTSVNMGTTTVTYGGNPVLPQNRYKRAYYQFSGWAMSIGGEKVMDDQATVSTSIIDTYLRPVNAMPSNTTVNIYALWSMQTYTLSFNGNNLTELDTSPTGDFAPITAPISLASDAHAATISIPVTVPEPDPVYSNYRFDYWCTDPSGTGNMYGEGASIDITSDTVLYAIWTTDSYTVSFDGNTADGGKSVSPKNVKYNTSVTLPACTWTKTGYVFTGWGENQNTTLPIAAGTSVIIRNDVTYYAQWAPIHYDIIFNITHNVDSNSIEPPDFDDLAYDQEFTIPQNELYYTGHTFLGWTLDPDSTTPDYVPGQTYTNATKNNGEKVALYDVWSSDAYTVTYDGNGGSGTMAPDAPLYDTNYTLRPNDFTREGYTFIGWSTTPGGEVEYSPGFSFKVPLENENSTVNGITFYAVWEPSRTVTFTIADQDNASRTEALNPDSKDIVTMDGETVSPGTTSKIVAQGKTLKESATSVSVTPYKGQQFKGWKVLEGGSLGDDYVSTKQDLSDYQIPMGAEDMTLVACFETIEYVAEVKNFVAGTIEISTNSSFDSTIAPVASDDSDTTTIKYIYGETVYVRITLADGSTSTLSSLQIVDGDDKTLVTYSGNKAAALTGDNGIYEGSVGDLIQDVTLNGTLATNLTLTVSAATIVNYYYIDANAGANGSITKSPADEAIPSETEAEVTIRPDEGYYISSIVVNGTEDTSLTGYTTTAIVKTFRYSDAVNGRITVVATFDVVPEFVTVSALKTEHGSFTLSATGKVGKGTTVTVTTTPDSGYAVKGIYLNGELVSKDKTYSFEAKNDTVVSVTFTVSGSSGGDSGTSVKTYTIKATLGVGGKVNFDGTKELAPGDSFTVIVTADYGYRVQDVRIDGDSIGRASTYTFENINENHKIAVDFQKGYYGSTNQYGVLTDDAYVDDDNSQDVYKRASSYQDVNAGSWYYNGIDYVVSNSLFKVSGSYFYPDAYATRAMLVEMIYNNEGAPTVGFNAGFADVSNGNPYAKAINWATSKGIVTGVSANSFAPDGSITREQLAAILYRYATYKQRDVSNSSAYRTSGFSDSGNISAYAKTAVNWATNIGLVNGRTAYTLEPSGLTTRAELCTIMTRFCNYVM